MVKFYLDGNEVTSPKNWEDLRLRILRDREVDTLLFTAETTLDWSDDGAAYLKAAIDSSGFCDTIPLEITDGNYTVYEGTIFLSSCEVNEGEGSVKSKTEDRSFYKSINSNKSIATTISAGKSKDGTAITAAERCLIAMHDHSAATDVKEVYCVRVYEAFRYLVEFMSNGVLSFASDTFDMGGDWEGLVITSGLKLRATINDDPSETGYKWPNPALPQLSFVRLYNEVRKKIPIGITIEDNTLRIEEISYLYADTTAPVEFTALESISTKFDQERLYSAVSVGSNKIEQASSFTFPERQPAVGFREEQFISGIDCNVDNVLDLVSDFIISSNVIQDCIANQAPDYDDDFFFITTTLTTATTGSSTRDDIFGTGDFFYNDALRNVNVLQRQIGGIPYQLLQYNGLTDPKFEANSSADEDATYNVTGTGTTPSYAPGGTLDGSTLIFDTEVSDPNSVYDTSVNFPPVRYHVFTAPSDALYGFEVFADFQTLVSESGTPTPAAGQFRLLGSGGAPVIRGEVEWALYDGGGVLQSSDSQEILRRSYDKTWTGAVTPVGSGGWGSEVFALGGTAPSPFTFSLFMPAGWQLVVTPTATFGAYQVQANIGWAFNTITLNQTLTLKAGSYLKCYSSSIEDLNIQVQEINQFIVRQHSFSTPLTQTDFEALKDASRSLVQFSMEGGDVRTGWIEEVSYNYVEGMANIKLLSKTATE